MSTVLPTIVPVIMSGGSGTRLWPYSVAMYPKQLLPLVNQDTTMLQDTALRLEGMANDCILVCNEAHRFLAAEQLQSIGQKAEIVLEPEGRNTAPAVGLAACLAAESDPDALLLVMPADHVIKDVAGFQAAVARGVEAAAAGNLVTFGIVPTRPETGYGYVKAAPDGNQCVSVDSFVEKPNLETAKNYVAGGEHFWNSGMFLFSAKSFLAELEQQAPEIHINVANSIKNRVRRHGFTWPAKDDFLLCPSDSIDYAIMEKTDAAMMIPLDVGWSDVGDWSSLHDARESDASGNTLDGDVIAHDCKNTFVRAENMLVAAVGVEDIVVVQTKNSVLVINKDRAQDIKQVVEQINSEDRGEAELHRQVFRPWGSFDSIDEDEGFQVKRLIVNPGAVLSMQKHAKRAEHWVVVRGKARITRNEEEFDLGVNESTYIAIGDVHCIANPFDDPVHIIEVQCGDYLGEDDIERLDDNYGREGTNT
jgi:mannose-1-phosphate guanylyltransferase/mannose-6-phosphate isomerase